MDIKETAVKLASLIEGITVAEIEEILIDFTDNIKAGIDFFKEEVIKSVENIKEMYS